MLVHPQPVTRSPLSVCDGGTNVGSGASRGVPRPSDCCITSPSQRRSSSTSKQSSKTRASAVTGASAAMQMVRAPIGPCSLIGRLATSHGNRLIRRHGWRPTGRLWSVAQRARQAQARDTRVLEPDDGWVALSPPAGEGNDALPPAEDDAPAGSAPCPRRRRRAMTGKDCAPLRETIMEYLAKYFGCVCLAMKRTPTRQDLDRPRTDLSQWGRRSCAEGPTTGPPQDPFRGTSAAAPGALPRCVVAAGRRAPHARRTAQSRYPRSAMA